jgi:hypothetical protein
MIDSVEKDIKRLNAGNRKVFFEQNNLRKHFDLKEMKIIVRRCLSCSCLFESVENRTCGCIKNS